MNLYLELELGAYLGVRWVSKKASLTSCATLWATQT